MPGASASDPALRPAARKALASTQRSSQELAALCAALCASAVSQGCLRALHKNTILQVFLLGRLTCRLRGLNKTIQLQGTKCRSPNGGSLGSAAASYHTIRSPRVNLAFFNAWRSGFKGRAAPKPTTSAPGRAAPARRPRVHRLAPRSRDEKGPGRQVRRPRAVPALPTRRARGAREPDRRAGPGRGRGRGRRPEGRGRIRTKQSRPAPRPAPPAPRAAFPGAATSPRAAPGPQLFPERPPPLAAGDAGPGENVRPGVRGGAGRDAGPDEDARPARGRGAGDRWDEGRRRTGLRARSGNVRPGCRAGPGCGAGAGLRGAGGDAGPGAAGMRGCGAGAWTRGRAGCEAEGTRTWRAVGAEAAGAGRGKGRGGRAAALTVLLAGALALSAPGPARARGGTAGPPPRPLRGDAAVTSEGRRRGLPAASSAVRALSPRLPSPPPPAPLRLLPAAAAAENGDSRPSPGWPRPTMPRAA